MDTLILASTSPRRATILEQLGISFRISPSDFEEVTKEGRVTREEVEQLVIDNARGKANAVASRETGIILGVDTVVFFQDKILGKPKDTQDAKHMLMQLNAKTHEVFSGFCLMYTEEGKQKEITGCDSALVHMRRVSEEVIARYVATKEPLDKAGSYGIQEKGAILMKGVEGDFYTVVGLPLAAVLEAAEQIHIPLV